MASTCCWYETRIPESLMKNITEDMDRVNENIFIKSEVNPNEPHLQNNIRKSQHCWIPSSYWIGGFLWHYIINANKDNFLYDISHIEQDMIQYTQYNKGDYYDWHTDIGRGDASNRKISLSILLNDDYEGGDLAFFLTGEQSLKPDAGQAIAFPSFLPHRVTPLTKGIRWSLVCWITGDPFR